MKYLVATLVLHLIYGAIIGWGNAAWTVAEEGRGAASQENVRQAVNP